MILRCAASGRCRAPRCRTSPPSWRARLMSPDACCASCGFEAAEGDVVDRREQQPERRAADDQRVAGVGLAGGRRQVARGPTSTTSIIAMPTRISTRASTSGRAPVRRRPQASAISRRHQPAGQHRQPGLGRREAEHALREQREDERRRRYRPKPSTMNRKIDAARSRFLQHAELDDRVRVARRQLPPEQRRRSTPPRRSTGRRSGGSLNQSSRCPPRARTAASRPRRSAGRCRASRRPPVRGACCGGSWRNVMTRNIDTIPIGTLMKKHQCQL